jgi:nicotinamide-nucleotide amidase
MLHTPTPDACAALLDALRAQNLTIATAESCTGGLIAAALTAIAGSSSSVLGGFVVYSNAMKTAQLGVPEAVLAAVGAVSEAVARLMAEGALARSGADIAISCTGIAGPGGATPDKPVGLVHMAAARRGGPTLHLARVFPGDRAEVRAATVDAVLDLARQAMAPEFRL